MNKEAMAFTNRIVDELPKKDQDDLEFSHRLFIYYMVKTQLDFGAVLLSRLLIENNFNHGLLESHAKKLLELGVVDLTVVSGFYLYHVNLVSQEIPCK